jgi:hypothetical protein
MGLGSIIKELVFYTGSPYRLRVINTILYLYIQWYPHICLNEVCHSRAMTAVGPSTRATNSTCICENPCGDTALAIAVGVVGFLIFAYGSLAHFLSYYHEAWRRSSRNCPRSCRREWEEAELLRRVTSSAVEAIKKLKTFNLSTESRITGWKKSGAISDNWE